MGAFLCYCPLRPGVSPPSSGNNKRDDALSQHEKGKPERRVHDNNYGNEDNLPPDPDAVGTNQVGDWPHDYGSENERQQVD